jgi:hypothetical protein
LRGVLEACAEGGAAAADAPRIPATGHPTGEERKSKAPGGGGGDDGDGGEEKVRPTVKAGTGKQRKAAAKAAAKSVRRDGPGGIVLDQVRVCVWVGACVSSWWAVLQLWHIFNMHGCRCTLISCTAPPPLHTHTPVHSLH